MSEPILTDAEAAYVNAASVARWCKRQGLQLSDRAQKLSDDAEALLKELCDLLEPEGVTAPRARQSELCPYCGVDSNEHHAFICPRRNPRRSEEQ